ncbi:acyl-CoA dehydrogenase family protein [Sciscionella marina]|uniref:acyl-CoA dehydrogenase family protein n=1 Tax=Sciscionella marina TaxID=508770 RepID=UPI00037E7038|nr:acyl-CoA dehydrogenase family protein [Sciscionella marina]
MNELLNRFAPVFERIAEGSVERERERELPHEPLEWLRNKGFTAVTVPTEYGGAGADAPELFALLIALGEADSNLPQLLRAHFTFVEGLLLDPARPDREDWFRRIAAGEIVGNASHERGSAAVGRLSTRITPDEGNWSLSGRKFYSTGSLFADWITTSAEKPDGERVSVSVPATETGVERIDDWDGFGQRLTGSGTTIYTDVAIDAELVRPTQDTQTRTVLPAFLQTVLLATLAGIGHAVVRDAAAFVRSRTRTYSQGTGATAASDPLVQSVTGRLSANAFAAETLVLGAAHRIATAHDLLVTGKPADPAIEKAERSAVQAQLTVIDLVLYSTTQLFDVGGASATSLHRALDRHWRNARTIASHNPAIYQERVLGDHLLNDTELTYFWSTGEAH